MQFSAYRPEDGPVPTPRETPARPLSEQHTDVAEERRDQGRRPFFRAASVMVETSGGISRPIPAFVRDISEGGIGLLHSTPLEPGDITVTIRSEFGAKCLTCEIQWCRPCGDGWYLSGGRLLERCADG